MKTVIHLVRHAEVENPKEIIYGRLPYFNLSESGVEQAEEIKRFFRNKKIAAIYSGPLLRARKTAEHIADGKLTIKTTRKLTEAGYSRWQGLLASKRPKKELQLYLANPEKAKLGESIEQVQKRTVGFILKIAKKNSGKEIILVSHAVPIAAAKLYFENKPLNLLSKILVKNCSITSIVFDNKLECEQVEYNEVVKAKAETI